MQEVFVHPSLSTAGYEERQCYLLASLYGADVLQVFLYIATCMYGSVYLENITF